MRVPFEAPLNVLRLDRNEDPFGWPEALLGKFLGTVNPLDLAAYPDSRALRQQLADLHSMAPENVWVTAGCDEVISLVFRTYLEWRDRVLTLSPSYGMYEVNGMSVDADFLLVRDSLDAHAMTDELLERLSAGPSIPLVVLASPNQPTGTEFSVDQLSRIASRCRPSGGVVFVDEAYYGFGARTAVDLIRSFDNVIIGRSFSKAFGLAGLRVGYALANSDRIEELSRLAPLCESTRMGISAASFILGHPNEHERHVEDVIAGRDAVAAALVEALQCPVLSPRTNFAVIAVSSVDQGKAVVSNLLSRGIAVRLVPDAGPLGPAIRLTSPGVQRSQPVADAIIQAFRECRAAP